MRVVVAHEWLTMLVERQDAGAFASRTAEARKVDWSEDSRASTTGFTKDAFRTGLHAVIERTFGSP